MNNLIPTTGAGLIIGQWGTAKTFLALDLAASITIPSQERFIDYRIKRHGGVLFIAAEGAGSIGLRWDGVVSDKLGLPVMDDIPAQPFAWIDFRPDLLNNGSAELSPVIEEVAAQMRQRFDCELVMIFIDTVAAAASFEDENDAAQSQKVMDRLHGLPSGPRKNRDRPASLA
jgi:AAA domain